MLNKYDRSSDKVYLCLLVLPMSGIVGFIYAQISSFTTHFVMAPDSEVSFLWIFLAMMVNLIISVIVYYIFLQRAKKDLKKNCHKYVDAKGRPLTEPPAYLLDDNYGR